MSDAAGVIAYGSYEYRKRGGEIHRRPIRREGLKLQERGWLVLNHEEFIPDIVRDQFVRSSAELRYD